MAVSRVEDENQSTLRLPRYTQVPFAPYKWFEISIKVKMGISWDEGKRMNEHLLALTTCQAMV